MEAMSALLAIIERETELVRAGKVREAMQLEEQKNELSRRYVVVVENLKNAQKHLAQVAPELLATLRRNHETFRAMPLRPASAPHPARATSLRSR